MKLPQPPFQSFLVESIGRVQSVWAQWFDRLQILINNLTNSGPTAGRPTKDLWTGQPYFDTTINAPVYWNGKTWISGVTKVTAIAPLISSGGSNPTISIPQATSEDDGYLSATDWITFDNKVSSVTGVAPVVSSGGKNPEISMPAANGSTSGYLTSSDWSAFSQAATFVNVKAYGATGDGSSDDTAAIQDAINANPGRTIYFPHGTYAITQVTIPDGCTILGDGQGNTFYYTGSTPAPNPMTNGSMFVPFGGNTNDLFLVTTTQSVNFEKVSFFSSAQDLGSSVKRTGGSYITFTTPGDTGTNFGSRINNCFFAYGYNNIQFNDNAGWVINQCYFANWANDSVYMANNNNHDYGDACYTNNYSDCNVGSSLGTGVHIHQVSSGGLKIVGNKFLAGSYQYLGELAAGAQTSIYACTGNSFEGASVAAIAFNTLANGYGNGIISGNQFTVFDSSSGVALVGTSFSNFYIGNNQFTHGTLTGTIATTSLNLTNCTNITIGANGHSGTSAAQRAVNMSGSNASIYFHAQTVNSMTAYAGSYTGCRFAVGQVQNANGSYSSAYGVYGALYISDPIPVSFTTAFPAAPIVNVTLDNPTSVASSGGVGCLVRNVSATGFTLYIITVSNSGQVNYSFNACLTGQ
jgi:hypothetical protein